MCTCVFKTGGVCVAERRPAKHTRRILFFLLCVIELFLIKYRIGRLIIVCKI